MSEEFKTITTQEELDKVISGRLKRESEKYQNQINELTSERDSLKIQLGEKDKALETGKSGAEKLNKRIEELEGKVGQYEKANMKRTIALQNGIPYDLADRLTGSNEEELIADAKKLAEYIAKPSNIPPLKSSEPKGSQLEGKEAALLQMSKNLINKGD